MLPGDESYCRRSADERVSADRGAVSGLELGPSRGSLRHLTNVSFICRGLFLCTSELESTASSQRRDGMGDSLELSKI